MLYAWPKEILKTENRTYWCPQFGMGNFDNNMVPFYTISVRTIGPCEMEYFTTLISI